MYCLRPRLNSSLCVLVLLGLWSGILAAQEQGKGSLVVSVRQELAQQSDAVVEIFSEGTTVPFTTGHVDAPIQLPAGTYRLALKVINGAITREKKAATERGDNRDGDWRNARGLAGRASHGSRTASRMVYWRLGIVLAGGA